VNRHFPYFIFLFDIILYDSLAQIIKLSIAIAIFLSYPLSGYVPISIIMTYVLKREVKSPHRIEYIIRVAFVILSTLNAIALPNLGPLLALVGTFSISLLNLVFPCCIELCLIYQDTYGKLLWKLWKNILMILFGLLIFFYGSYRAIADIIEEYGGSKGDTTTEATTTTTVGLTTKLVLTEKGGSM